MSKKTSVNKDDKIRTGKRRNEGGGAEEINKLGAVGGINEDDNTRNDSYDQIIWNCTFYRRIYVKLFKCMDKFEEQSKILQNKQDQIKGKISIFIEGIDEGQNNNKAFEIRLETMEAQSVALREKVDEYDIDCSKLEMRLVDLEANATGFEKLKTYFENRTSYSDFVRKETVQVLQNIMKEEFEQFQIRREKDNIKLKE
ncbi:hypothetical protein SK128_027961 [Halocaridina rubra]|uniref:Uncharacterized protein n=1 Tax=Halocaridina rubra TaxID=373956 RepID=A0AAN8WWQ5_HALRR